MTKNRRPPAIGLVGTNAAGKGSVAKILQDKGFSYISLSDLLRKKVEGMGLDTDRDTLTAQGRNLRESHGPGFLADLALEEDTTGIQKWVVDSIRHPEEIKILRANLPVFLLWAVDASPELRFSRAKARGRAENLSSLDTFLAQEASEKSSRPNAQQLHNCLAMAEITFWNEGSFDELKDSVTIELEKRNDLFHTHA